MTTPYINNVEEIIKNCPKAFKLFNEKIIENLQKVEGIQEDLKALLGDELAKKIIQFDCRKLFDFFDEQEIFCSTIYNTTTEKWEGVVMNAKFEGYSSRHELEIDILTDAFNKLEQLL